MMEEKGSLMSMTTVATVAWEGAPACRDCQQLGEPVCAHVGFTPSHWDSLIGQRAHVPGLAAHDDYPHIVRGVQISDDRKTATLTLETVRPLYHDLARHLSVQAATPPAAVRAMHHETGDVLEQGYYERPLVPGESVRIDRDQYVVRSVEWPHRNEFGATGDAEDLQVAHLQPMPVEPIQPVHES